MADTDYSGLDLTDPFVKQATVEHIATSSGLDLTDPFIVKALDEHVMSLGTTPTPEPEMWKDVIQPTPARAMSQTMQGVGGVTQFLGDVLGSEWLSSKGKNIGEEARAVDEQINKEHPIDPNSWKGAASSALTSMYSQAPALALGALTGGATVALAPMGVTTAGQTYSERKDKGFSTGGSALSALADGTIEVGTELLPTKVFFDLLKPAGKQAFAKTALKIGELYGAEVVGESLATLLQDLNTKYMSDPKLSNQERLDKMGEYFQSGEAITNWQNTAKATFIQTTLMAGAGAAGSRIFKESTPVEQQAPPGPPTAADIDPKVKAFDDELAEYHAILMGQPLPTPTSPTGPVASRSTEAPGVPGGVEPMLSTDALLDRVEGQSIVSATPGAPITRKATPGTIVPTDRTPAKVVYGRTFKSEIGANQSLLKKISDGTLKPGEYTVVPADGGGYQIQSMPKETVDTRATDLMTVRAALDDVRGRATGERRQDETTGEWTGNKSTNDWFAATNVLDHYVKQYGEGPHAEALAKQVNSVSIEAVRSHLEKGTALTPSQKHVLDYLRQKVAPRNAEIELGVQQAQAEGIDISQPVDIPVGALNLGDKVIIQVKGSPEVLTHRGYDDQGNAVLQGQSVILRHDPFEMLPVQGIKQAPAGNVVFPKSYPDEQTAQKVFTVKQKKGDIPDGFTVQSNADGTWGIKRNDRYQEDTSGPVATDSPMEGSTPIAQAESTTGDTGGVETPTEPGVLSHKKIGPNDLINGITRDAAGKMLAAGDDEVIAHIQEGVAKHGAPALEDAIRNQELVEVAHAPKNQRAEVRDRIAKLTPQIDKVLNGLDTEAHQAATSPRNDLPQPTEKQKEAGNYQKGHVSLHGLDISIENPAGSKRSGVDQSGKAWSIDMKHHYGYIKGTIGPDKDHVDVFMGDRPEDPSRPVFVVDQVDPKTGKYDEPKVIMGAANESEARQVYLDNYEKGWKGLGAITPMSIDEFKSWARDPKRSTKPVEYRPEPPTGTRKQAVSTVPITAERIVNAPSMPEVMREISRIFGTPEELQAMDDAITDDRPITGILGVAGDYMADLEYAARNRDTEEVNAILRQIANDPELPADKRALLSQYIEPSGTDGNVQPTAPVSSGDRGTQDTGGESAPVETDDATKPQDKESQGKTLTDELTGMSDADIAAMVQSALPTKREQIKEKKVKTEVSKMKVTTEAIRESTGEKIKIQENADEALLYYDNQLSLLGKLLDCLNS